jgi:hypothetical protein
MKVGDMVRYVREERYVFPLPPDGLLWEQEPDTDVALVVGRPPENRGEFVDVLWNDGEVCSHAVGELEVAYEYR